MIAERVRHPESSERETEAWVSDRMINRYWRQAWQVSELRLGRLAPLDRAIPELADGPPRVGQRWAKTAKALDTRRKKDKQKQSTTRP